MLEKVKVRSEALWPKELEEANITPKTSIFRPSYIKCVKHDNEILRP
jgi:hypothetical protein